MPHERVPSSSSSSRLTFAAAGRVSFSWSPPTASPWGYECCPSSECQRQRR